ncbi:MAG: hypothetical protein WCR23_00830 [Planctomycetota bacterium]
MDFIKRVMRITASAAMLIVGLWTLLSLVLGPVKRSEDRETQTRVLSQAIETPALSNEKRQLGSTMLSSSVIQTAPSDGLPVMHSFQSPDQGDLSSSNENFKKSLSEVAKALERHDSQSVEVSKKSGESSFDKHAYVMQPLPARSVTATSEIPRVMEEYRPTLESPPPPLLDANAPPPLAGVWPMAKNSFLRTKSDDQGLPLTAEPYADQKNVLQTQSISSENEVVTNSIKESVASISKATRVHHLGSRLPGYSDTHIVKDGDDLVRIALQAYGHSGAAEALWMANRDQMTDPALLPIGIPLRLPADAGFPRSLSGADMNVVQMIEPLVAPSFPENTAELSSATKKTTGNFVSSASLPIAANSTYVSAIPPGVQVSSVPWLVHSRPATGEALGNPASSRPKTIQSAPGDTFVILAKKFYGDATMAKPLWEANRDRVRSPQLLVPGIELRLP